MKILEDIYIQLLDSPAVPPESGGIIGSSNGEVINHVVFDRGQLNHRGGVYMPDTQFLNQIIKDWNECEIEFRGIFHTHAAQWPELSNSDRIYIIEILKAMPSYIQNLYFPLIFPGEKIKAYCARKNGNVISIVDENIDIIKKREEMRDERNE